MLIVGVGMCVEEPEGVRSKQLGIQGGHIELPKLAMTSKCV